MGYLGKSLRTNLDDASNIAAPCWGENYTMVSATCHDPIDFLHTPQGAVYSKPLEIEMGGTFFFKNIFKPEQVGCLRKERV